MSEELCGDDALYPSNFTLTHLLTDMRKFNTSGPNIPEKHYTIYRTDLIKKGVEMVKEERYFTIWAPRQTGKSTYFHQLSEELRSDQYQIAHINFENYQNASLKSFMKTFTQEINHFWDLSFPEDTEISSLFQLLSKLHQHRFVLIIDEVEGINADYLGDFLHSIRSLYHSRANHSLKSVILVGVSNITGVIKDHASPFNIADNLNVPYFTFEEVVELFRQHENETGQLFEKQVIRKIAEITANQPGLVNGFAKKLVDDFPDKKQITFDDYLKVEDWYLTEAIDKNFSNILNKAEEQRPFVERLLFTEDNIPFEIDRPSIKALYTNGLIRKDQNGFVTFWVPFYKKRLYKAFYPYTNGEQREISREIFPEEYFSKSGSLLLGKLIESYKAYVKRRGFEPHREKDEHGNYKSIKEAALIYSFETYIHAFVTQVGGKIYREAQTGLGKSDMIININSQELLIETKIYYSPRQFQNGKSQLAYYCNSLGQKIGIYLVFCPNHIRYPDYVKEMEEEIEGVMIHTFLIEYDEVKW